MPIESIARVAFPLVGLALPYLVFMVHNNFQCRSATFIRSLIAVGAGWAFWLSFSFAAYAMMRAAATTEHQIDSLDSGKELVIDSAIVYGWVFPAITVALSWGLQSWLSSRNGRMGSNKPLQPIGREGAPSG